jgi:two-component system chemotaxis response regulator CheY
VEDDFTCRVSLQGLLSKRGECHVAVNGAEAVDAFRAALEAGLAYDLICMDINLPAPDGLRAMDGRQAVEQIRAIEADGKSALAPVKILMTTSVRDMKTIVASFKAMCDAYLFKPIDGESLEEHLRSFGLIGGTESPRADAAGKVKTPTLVKTG